MKDASMVTGKPNCTAKADPKSPTNQKYVGGELATNTPSGGAGFGKSSKQSSGNTEHGRMTVATKVESTPPSGMPNVHSGGGSGTIAGVA